MRRAGQQRSVPSYPQHIGEAVPNRQSSQLPEDQVHCLQLGLKTPGELAVPSFLSSALDTVL